MKIIDEKRIVNDFIVLITIKIVLITPLRKTHHIYIWTFEDNSLDLNMLRKTNWIIIVINEEQVRSKIINAVLTNAIDYNDLRARQTVFPSNASPRLNIIKLSIIKLTEPEFVKSFLCDRCTNDDLQIFYVTDKNATKLLATSMRDATVADPDLRKAHYRVGW